MLGHGVLQSLQTVAAHVVHAPTEDLIDQVVLAAEVIIDRGDIHVRATGDLAQGCGAKALLGEQLLRRMQDPVLGREVLEGHFGLLNQTLV